MTRIQLPDGCTGLDMASGRRYTASKPGGQVEVTSRDARHLNTSWYGQAGVINGAQSLTVGTKRGRWCGPCRFLAQAWSAVCPRCGQPTTPEEAPCSLSSPSSASPSP